MSPVFSESGRFLFPVLSNFRYTGFMMKTSKKLSLVASSGCGFLLLVASLVPIFGCSPKEAVENDLIAAHSNGVISAADPIRIRFSGNMVDAEKVGTEISPSPISLRPKAPGHSRWTAPDVLSFQPDSLLKSGEKYEVFLDPKGLGTGTGEILSFDINIMGQSFEVEIAGLDTTDESGRLQLSGLLRTADVARPEAVQKVLQARLDGKDLPISFSHESDGRTHPFVVKGIQQGNTEGKLLLEWDGTPIEAENRGRQEIIVPKRGSFQLTGIRAVEGGEKHIEIRFSEKVDPKQDLLGLIAVGSHRDLRFDVEGNLVHVNATGGWKDEEELRIDGGIRSAEGTSLGSAVERKLYFQPPLPSIRFAGEGVILPSTSAPRLPVEVVSLRAVEIEASQVFENNMPQFFQVNSLGETDELHRVGRVVWRKRIQLERDRAPGQSRVVGLDLSPLIAAHPGGLYHLKIRFSPADIDYPCREQYTFPTPAAEQTDSGEIETSYWDQWEASQDYSWRELFDHRKNPCHPGFYRSYYDHDIEIERNVLLSNLGLVAKKDDSGQIFVLATDLRTAAPIADAEIHILDYQQQELVSGKTGPEGMLRLRTKEKAFLIVARSQEGAAYLKLDDGQALSFARFDVGGVSAKQGLKGFIYGERDVWRPGDQLHIGFILSDPEGRLPEDHPLRFEFRNPQGQLVASEVQHGGQGQFYVFEPRTSTEAPTGIYSLKVEVGDAVFEKKLKIAMVRPNRLRIALETEEKALRAPKPRLRGLLEAAWLHGGEAGKLKARINARLEPVATRFSSFPDFVFDDPTREFNPEEMSLFDGRLDAHGQVRIDEEIPIESPAPGKLQAVLDTRVFEPGGAFSVNESAVSVSPWEHYVGLRTEPGDSKRGMLLTDTGHRVDLLRVDQDGRPVSGEVKVSLYKISWRWWWEKGPDESLVEFAHASSLTAISSSKVRLKNGEGSWDFSVAYPEWGRFLVMVEDENGGHRASKVIYIDWPGWAGKARKGAGDSAEILSLSADRDAYDVGDEIEITIPSAEPGKILVSLEKGGKILSTDLIDASAERTLYRVRATKAMAPNIYVVVSFLQPHEHPKNDLPIRMYGVLPLKINPQDSRLEPQIETTGEFTPESTTTIRVSERRGREMDYTLAVVDEGLLGLTGFKTPDPWSAFYSREALRVRSWDLYDEVAGAWGSALESTVAVGGGESGKIKTGRKKERRFPPMVRFLGPFHLGAGEKAAHQVDIPLYLGSVRVMVVAAHGGAYGRAEKEVLVRKDLMVLGSLPRQLSPGEEFQWPISVFVMKDGPSDVKITARVEGKASLVKKEAVQLHFESPGEKLINIPIRSGPGVGAAKFVVQATGLGERSRQEIDLQVRQRSVPVTTTRHFELEVGSARDLEISVPENPAGAKLGIEISPLPPIDLDRRLGQLIHYPYGCLEQTTSAAFAQLYLKKLVDLPEPEEKEVQKNVSSAIERIRRFQLPNGAMSLWPVASGGFGGSFGREADVWATSYAGHFLIEAKREGYRIPAEVFEKWESWQRNEARRTTVTRDSEIIAQAYRLETLALAGAPELGAMNRLRETPRLPDIARWQLASAYALSGRLAAARELARKAPIQISSVTELGGNYGSQLRDQAIVLESLHLLRRSAEIPSLIRNLSETLASDEPLSTQSIAFALLAVAENTSRNEREWECRYNIDHQKTIRAVTKAPVMQRDIPVGSRSFHLENTSDGRLWAVLTETKIPGRAEERDVSQRLKLEEAFLDGNGKAVEPEHLAQGEDFIYLLTVEGSSRRLENLALSVPVADGWEIRSVETDGPIDFQDLRDARVDVFFGLEARKKLELQIHLTASFLGRYYLPMVHAEAMYDPSIAARKAGRWVEVVAP